MTIEEMKKNAMLKMNREIERLQDNNDVTTWRDVSNVLCAYLFVGLVSDDEYLEYCERIRNANVRINF